eukprot:1393373-Amorphochlora_amoeboformis.AAC.2
MGFEATYLEPQSVLRISLTSTWTRSFARVPLPGAYMRKRLPWHVLIFLLVCFVFGGWVPVGFRFGFRFGFRGGFWDSVGLHLVPKGDEEALAAAA